MSDEHWTTKCRAFTDKESLEELEDELNKFFENKWIISSPIFIRETKSAGITGISMSYVWDCMVYYKVKGTEVLKAEIKEKQEVKQSEKASDKQINLLKVLNYKGTLDLTMSEAHALIKTFKEKK